MTVIIGHQPEKSGHKFGLLCRNSNDASLRCIGYRITLLVIYDNLVTIMPFCSYTRYQLQVYRTVATLPEGFKYCSFLTQRKTTVVRFQIGHEDLPCILQPLILHIVERPDHMCWQLVRLPVNNTRHQGADIAFGVKGQPVERTHWIALGKLVNGVNHQHNLAPLVGIHEVADYLHQLSIGLFTPIIPFKPFNFISMEKFLQQTGEYGLTRCRQALANRTD